MNKTWKSFDCLTTTPSLAKSLRKFSHRTTNENSSRVIAQLKRNINQSSIIVNRETNTEIYPTVKKPTISDDESKIEDVSDEEQERITQLTGSECASKIDYCSAPSLDPKEVTFYKQSHLESDIDDVSEEETLTKNDVEIPETSSDDSDCESINCKRVKTARLDFFHPTTPGRITDCTFVVSNVTPGRTSLEKSSSWIKPLITENIPKGYRKTPVGKQRSCWKKLDETFKESTLIDVAKSPPAQKWKTLNETFKASPSADIDCRSLTPDKSFLIRADDITIEQVPESEGCFYDSGMDRTLLHQQQTPRFKYRKGCPLSWFQLVLNEKTSKQSFWLYERQAGLVAGRRPVKIESIRKIFGRIAISYLEADKDDAEVQVEHVFYIDPSEKQLKLLQKGSLIEVEYDLEPHRINGRQIVHLGVCKIKAVD